VGPRRAEEVTVRSSCECAERTGDLVVFTCPLCMEAALEHLQALTTRGTMITVDKSGSVSALVEVEEGSHR